MYGDVRAMVGWGPVHLMPARIMRPSPPRMYRLHSAAPAPAAPAAAAAAAGPGVPNDCAKGVTTSRQERIVNQLAAAEAQAHLQSCRSSIGRAGQLVSATVTASRSATLLKAILECIACQQSN